MTTPFDPTDLPRISSDTLALAMRLLIEDGRALILLRGAAPEDRARLEARFWTRFDGPTGEGVTALLRLWGLVEVFQARRMRSLLLDRGYALIADAVREAARQRINLSWGFNPQRMLGALAAKRQPAQVLVVRTSVVKGARIAA